MIREFANELLEMGGLDSGTWGIWLYVLIRFTMVATIFIGTISVVVMFSIWWERKVGGHVQSRVGPMHVGCFHGWLQSLADGAKLLLKEDLMPRGADGFLFKFAPYISFAPVFAAYLALPFSPQLVFESGFNIGVLYLLAVLAIEAMGTIMAGWGSNSKWAVYGAMREACQIVSYEIPLGISILCGVLVAGTLNLVELGYLQGAGIWDWFVFHSPFMMGAFLLYFIASLASNKRAPFDLPESESELVAGFHTEYSGIRWSFFFFAEYGAMFVVGAIQALLFLGGWNSPLGVYDPIYWACSYNPVEAGQLYFSGAIGAATSWGGKADVLGMTGFQLALLNGYCLFWFFAKAMTVIWVQIWLRWTLPRIRIDQVLHTCVKVLLPMSLVTLAGVAVWLVVVPQPDAVRALVVDESSGLYVATGAQIQRLGHLASPNPWFQVLTQSVLTLIGVGFVLSFVVIMALGWWGVIFKSNNQPRKSIFEDIMPVGREIAFTRGPTEEPRTADGDPAPAG